MMNVRVNLFLLCLSAAAAAPVEEECDKTKCPGPLKFYEELSCTPIYKNPGDCCAAEYGCEYLKKQSDKCNFNGYEYSIGEPLRKEDQSCWTRCTCVEAVEGGTTLQCVTSDYAFPVDEGCYLPQNATDCFPGPQICPKTPEDRPKCVVDGKEYLDGEVFYPAAEPETICYCGPGYAGENVAPYCKPPPPKSAYCNFKLINNYEIQHKCAPVDDQLSSPRSACIDRFRCQSDTDQVIKHEVTNGGNEDSKCQYGNLTMNIGDELNAPASVGFGKLCTKCVCEVPPVPTCLRLADDTC